MGKFETLFWWGTVPLCLMFVVAMGAYLYQQFSGRKVSWITFDKGPLVGVTGRGFRLHIKDDGVRLRVDSGLPNRLILLFCGGLFGPGIIYLYLFHREQMNSDIPLPVFFLMGTIVFIMTHLFIHYSVEILLVRPYLEIDRAGVGIAFVRWGKPVAQWQFQDLRQFEIVRSWFRPSKGFPVENFSLVMHPKAGETVELLKTSFQSNAERVYKVCLELMPPS